MKWGEIKELFFLHLIDLWGSRKPSVGVILVGEIQVVVKTRGRR